MKKLLLIMMTIMTSAALMQANGGVASTAGLPEAPSPKSKGGFIGDLGDTFSDFMFGRKGGGAAALGSAVTGIPPISFDLNIDNTKLNANSNQSISIRAGDNGGDLNTQVQAGQNVNQTSNSSASSKK